MKPSARIQATIDILERISANKRVPMDAMVGDYMRGRRYIGSKDRAAIVERCYHITRAHARLGWWLEQSHMPDTPRNRVLAYLVLAETADLKRVKDLFDGTQYAPEILDQAEETFISALEGKKLDDENMPEVTRVECPLEYEASLRGYFGDAFKTEMAAMLEPATLDLRVNSFTIDRDSVQKSLEKDGIETDPTPYSPWGLRARAKVFISKTKAFNKGWISIQDEGSQLIAHICDVKPGMQVLDYCAGAGGKTLALASAMNKKGRIVATDNDDKRLAKGKQRYKKSGLADIIEARPLTEEKNRKWLRRQKGTFDLTLVDVPCSGTGTWRRNPDMRWVNYGPDLAALTTIQAKILDKVAHTVKTGGKLVYATCSLLPEENEQQIEAFLERHPDFELLPLDETKGLGTPYMRLTPHRHNTDGFFAAIMVRR